MSRYVSLSFALASFVALASSSDAFAHCFVGARFFPATLATDDPCVADEMSLPTVDDVNSQRVAKFGESITTRLDSPQLGLFATGVDAPPPRENPVTTRLLDLDVNSTTPLEALTLLSDLQRLARDVSGKV